MAISAAPSPAGTPVARQPSAFSLPLGAAPPRPVFESPSTTAVPASLSGTTAYAAELPLELPEDRMRQQVDTAPIRPAIMKLRIQQSKKVQQQGPTKREMRARGMEGSRKRQRWENDRFLHNPHFTAPKASDFRPGPLHPRRIVPYQYASLYSHPSFPHPITAPIPDHDRVPKQLKARLKKSRAAVALLETLEREVREFLYGEGLEGSDGEVSEGSDRDGEGMEIDGKFGEYREENREDYEESVDGDSGDEGEEEIVFVSRKERQQQHDGAMRERCVYHSEEGDEGGKFGRWLVHSLAGYYGIHSWSVTHGTPAIRYAYIAKTPETAQHKVPKPLWMMM
ncbi:hypothetical protein FPQ18DRAFT_334334 [Pyronema domesticum]|uniref:R3H-associated N-terminal domain-containing protein n=1 Tax=Pyronema omphalodes (strain CBS 100304) TaxID=1076935 RepID=U4L7S7_PYROM|nr:hypothetical protein FPQ18DRAFT_334334 [Pyronema domesticum]CCX06189.1 Similar to hypothetical protein [Tuber melanosporum Mel28]; acc. no. XP_002841774 [Pyronema omphalodes CBS 100304]